MEPQTQIDNWRDDLNVSLNPKFKIADGEPKSSIFWMRDRNTSIQISSQQ